MRSMTNQIGGRVRAASSTHRIQLTATTINDNIITSEVDTEVTSEVDAEVTSEEEWL